jgi:hypothetical protein
MVYHGGENKSVEGDGMYGYFEPTYEFLEAWKKVISKSGDAPSISIEFDKSQLSKKAHKSVKGSDPRRNFADIMNLAYNDYNPGYTSGLMVGSVYTDPYGGGEIDTRHNMSDYRKPFWKNFKNKMTKGGKIRKYLRQEAKIKGITLV